MSTVEELKIMAALAREVELLRELEKINLWWRAYTRAHANSSLTEALTEETKARIGRADDLLAKLDDLRKETR